MVTHISNSSSARISRFSYNSAENKITIEDTKSSIDNTGASKRNLHIYTDTLGRKTQITIQDGTETYTTNYSYDSLGRLDKLTDKNGNLIVDYDYDAVSGRLAKETNGNGTYTTYSYDLAGQLISLVNAQGDGTVNSRFDYAYDSLGRRTEVATLDGTWNYEYFDTSPYCL